MSSPSNRKDQPRSGTDGIWVLVAAIGFGLVLAYVNIAVRVGHLIDGTAGQDPSSPFELFFNTLKGKSRWTTTVTITAAVLAVLLTALVTSVLVSRSRRKSRRTRVDTQASYMGRGRDVDGIRRKSVTATATRLGITGSPGVPIGAALGTGETLLGSWEDMHLDIWGPRTGKTTSRAVPAVLDAPGAVVCTSNKRDLLDATRLIRERHGDVWVFDPQQVALEPAQWWWDPLSYVTDDTKARGLAGHFIAGSRSADARADAYFDGDAQNLLASLILAAALDHRPITDVYRWLIRPNDQSPVEILRDSPYDLVADQLAGIMAYPDEQRGGVYGTAKQMATCLTSPSVASWVTSPSQRGEVDPRPSFDPHAFVRDGSTLYALSMEGEGTTGPLTTALTVAVTEAATDLATRMAGGRLSVPMLCVLDEAANVCRWRKLPDLYSHFGSRGIIIMTILQSWSQGVEVWGASGMQKLWSSANVKVYGGGVSEEDFLDKLSKLIGDYDKLTSSISAGKGYRSTSRQLTRERILDVEQLAALPKGRAVVLSSGNRAAMIRTKPWMNGPHAQDVRDSITINDPNGAATISDAFTQLRQVDQQEGNTDEQH